MQKNNATFSPRVLSPFFRPFLASMLLMLLGVSCETTSVTQTLTRVLQQTGGGETLSLQEIVAGLREALTVGSKQAISQVSRPGGFSKSTLRIPAPRPLKKPIKALRKIGMGRLADQFEDRMNLAAEQAAAKATPIFLDAVRQMTFADAKKILYGSKTAATDYFRKKTETRLRTSFAPIVRQQMNRLGTVKVYQDLVTRYQALPFTSAPKFNLENYVVDKTMDGLFATLAGEEAKIRQDPAARTTQLLRRVFRQAAK